MKPKFFSFLLGVAALCVFNTANAFTGLVIFPKTVPAQTTVVEPTNPLSLLTAKQFLALSPKKFQQLTGKKMNLVQRMEYKMLQHEVKKMVKKGQVVTMADVQKRFDELGTMNVLGFLLGLILGPIGVIIALILKETGNVDASVLRWSLYGLLIWLVIFLLVILL
jgi:hypothetical protein